MNRSLTRWSCILLVLFSFMTSAENLKAERLAIPEGVFYYSPAASVFGSEATWVNPAGLARYRPDNYQFMLDYFDGSIADSWGLVTAANGIGMAYRNLDNPTGEDFKEVVFALGSKLRDFGYTGGSYRYFRRGPSFYLKRHFWNLGFMSNTGRPLNWAMTFSNLNRNKVDGERTEIEQRYSLSYRPVSGIATLSADMFLSSGTRFRNAEFIYHLEIRPKTGLYLSGYIDSDNNFQFGFRANLTQYFVGSQSNFKKNGDGLGSTAFFGKTSMRQPSLLKERNRRLALRVNGSVPENPTRPVFGKKQIAFTTMILNIYRAANDPAISEMILSVRSLAMGMGRAQELREALIYFKSRGKRVTCHLEHPNNLGYFVATVADQILIPPISQLNLVGLRAELTFLGGTLEKLGINADIIRIGDHKTAPERYTETEASYENREQINRLLDDLYGQFVSTIAAGRGLSTDSVIKVINNGPFTSKEALEYGLVDGLSYRDEMRGEFLSSMPEISFRRYVKDTIANDNFTKKPVIAVVVAEGDIKPNSGSGWPLERRKGLTPSSVGSALRQARLDRNISAVLFRVNSPGGFALAADDIYHATSKAAKRKEFVVSMANVGASGGYQIAMSGSRLFANPASMTGSIGIFGGKADLSELYDKIDLHKELFTRGDYAGMLTNMRPFTDLERKKYRSQLFSFYEYFVELVAENRSLTIDSTDAIARGQVWTGREALANGLIDQNGGIKNALDYIADMNGYDDYRVKILPERRPWFNLPGGRLLGGFASAIGLVDSEIDLIEDAERLLDPEGGIFTRMPFDIEIE